MWDENSKCSDEQNRAGSLVVVATLLEAAVLLVIHLLCLLPAPIQTVRKTSYTVAAEWQM